MRRRSGPGGMGTPPGLVRRCQDQRIRHAHGLKISLVGDVYFTKYEIREMAENWVHL